MRRALAAVVTIACLLGLGWAVSARDRVEERAARLTLQFDRSNDEIARLRAALNAAEDEAEAKRRAARLWRRRHEDVRWELSSARADLRRLQALAGASAPADLPRRVDVIESTGGSYLVAGSAGGTGKGALRIWRVTLSATDGSATVRWRRVYEMSVDGHSIEIATPRGTEREPFDAWYVGVSETHDLTRDGLDDLLVFASSTGTAGCSVTRVLANGAELREIFRLEDCESGFEAENGLLVYTDALQPKGCKYIHGCGSRTEWLRWDGDSWEVVRTRRTR